MKTYKKHIIQDIEDGKIINIKGPDKRTNKYWKKRYENLLKVNQAMMAEITELKRDKEKV